MEKYNEKRLVNIIRWIFAFGCVWYAIYIFNSMVPLWVQNTFTIICFIGVAYIVIPKSKS